MDVILSCAVFSNFSLLENGSYSKIEHITKNVMIGNRHGSAVDVALITSQLSAQSDRGMGTHPIEPIFENIP